MNRLFITLAFVVLIPDARAQDVLSGDPAVPEWITKASEISASRPSVWVPEDLSLIKVSAETIDGLKVEGFSIESAQDNETLTESVIFVRIPPTMQIKKNPLTSKEIQIGEGTLRISVEKTLPSAIWLDRIISGRSEPIVLELKTSNVDKEFDIASSCDAHPLRFSKIKVGDLPENIRVECSDFKNGVWIFFFHGVNYRVLPLQSPLKSEVTDRFTRFYAPDRLATQGVQLGVVKLSSRTRIDEPVSYQVSLLSDGVNRKSALADLPTAKRRPPKEPSWWRGYLYLGPTLISYREVGSVRTTVSETVLTARAGMSAILIKDKLDLGFSGFTTVAVLSVSPSTLAQSRYLGINGRLGYRWPHRWLGGQPTLQLGYYYWGMSVTDASYGISSALGPQFLIGERWGGGVERVYLGYIKFAPLSDGASFGLTGNYELALGGSMQINSPGYFTHPIFVGFDYSLFAFSSTASIYPVPVSASLSTISFTVGVEF